MGITIRKPTVSCDHIHFLKVEDLEERLVKIEPVFARIYFDLFREPTISDFLLDKDALFARLTLSDEELKLYQTIHAQIAPRAPAPDLVIYLQAGAETLAERVARRANPIEAGISESYLRALAESYAGFFHQYDAAPLLIVNSEHLNPITRDEDLQLLLARIQAMRGRREYFNVAS